MNLHAWLVPHGAARSGGIPPGLPCQCYAGYTAPPVIPLPLPCLHLPGGSTPAIARQLDALGGDHIGYSSKRFPELGLTMVGARPFSKGGKQWSDVAGQSGKGGVGLVIKGLEFLRQGWRSRC